MDEVSCIPSWLNSMCNQDSPELDPPTLTSQCWDYGQSHRFMIHGCSFRGASSVSDTREGKNMWVDHAGPGRTRCTGPEVTAVRTWRWSKQSQQRTGRTCGEGRGVDFLRPFSVRPLWQGIMCTRTWPNVWFRSLGLTADVVVKGHWLLF